MMLLLGVLLIVAGLVGLVVPLVPGTVLIALGAFVVASADGFVRVGWIPLSLIVVLAVLGIVADMLASLAGARRAGASGWGMAGAVLGLLVGLPFGLLGVIAGPAIGAVTLEWLKDPNLRRAGRAGAGVVVGFIIGTAIKYAAAFAMIGILLVAYLW
jgi:uncharacterized protein